MDPNATWQTLVVALQALHDAPDDDEVRADVIQCLTDLAAWLYKGGFPPTLSAKDLSG